MLFQGEEWGASAPFQYFTNHQDEKLGERVRQGRRREFAAQGWNEAEIPDPQALETFERCKLNWTEQSEAWHADLLEWHRRLIALRQAEPSLRDGRMERVQTRHDELERWMVVEREPFVVACNFSGGLRKIQLRARRHKILMASTPLEVPGNGTVILPSESVAVLRMD